MLVYLLCSRKTSQRGGIFPVPVNTTLLSQASRADDMNHVTVSFAYAILFKSTELVTISTTRTGAYLTHWGRVTHICVSKLTIIGSDNGLSPCRRQAIIWTNAGILLIRTLGTNFIEILSEIRAFSFKEMHLKMPSAKWRPFCLGLNVLTHTHCPFSGPPTKLIDSNTVLISPVT